jgi:lipid-A-disaccharide synthase
MVIVAPSLDTEIVKSFVPKELDLSMVFAKDDPFKLIKLCDACIVASGTATLVTALAEVPMVIMYKMNALTASVARRVVRGRFFGMPNLILDSKVVPELFQEDASSKQIAGEILKYLQDSKYYQSTKAQLALIKTRLGSAGAIGRVVDEIQNALKGD